MSERATWTSKTGFLLAALGSAIGLGNIWRFPYMAYRNGGGAFLIPYFVALFLCRIVPLSHCSFVALFVVGIPLLMLEFGLGHHFRRALPQSLGRIHPRFSWIGWWAVSFVMFGIVAYYGVVIAWCGNYLVYALTQPWGDADGVNRFFDEQVTGSVVGGEAFVFYGTGADGQPAGFRFGRVNWEVLIGLAGVWIVNWLISRRRLQHGVELANEIFIPILMALTAIMVAWSWSFEGAAEGRSVYLTPDWSMVFRPKPGSMRLARSSSRCRSVSGSWSRMRATCLEELTSRRAHSWPRWAIVRLVSSRALPCLPPSECWLINRMLT